MAQPKTNQEIYIRENGTRGVRSIGYEDSQTSQEFKESCDVNIMIARYVKTNNPEHLRLKQAGVYLDLVGAPDYVGAMQTIRDADYAFQQLPAKVRQRFLNDPAEMIKFLADEQNHKEAVELGLMVPRVEQTDPQLEELKGLRQDLAKAEKRKSKVGATETA